MGTTNFDTVDADSFVGNVTGNVTGVVTGGVTPATIADPGNAGAIPVTASGRVAIVTAGAETRTLAVPTIIGQRLLIYMKTDGGDCVITVAAAINASGNTIITLGDAGDAIELVAIENGANLRWVVGFNSGITLS